MIKCWQVYDWICGDASKILKLPDVVLKGWMLTHSLFNFLIKIHIRLETIYLFMWWYTMLFCCLPQPDCSFLFVYLIFSTVSTEGPPSCPKGCDRCSEYNGCIKCKPKLFIFLERNDIRQIGVCLASCPMGYFGMRNPEGNNRCTREFCFVL